MSGKKILARSDLAPFVYPNQTVRKILRRHGIAPSHETPGWQGHRRSRHNPSLSSLSPFGLSEPRDNEIVRLEVYEMDPAADRVPDPADLRRYQDLCREH
jgi:hypothetical protein